TPGKKTRRLKIMLVQEHKVTIGMILVRQTIDKILHGNITGGGNLTENRVQFLDQLLTTEDLTIRHKMASNRRQSQYLTICNYSDRS
ncbi:MAG: hypothetical protein ACYTBZ_20405, partial [Planctomycetota bacterium]